MSEEKARDKADQYRQTATRLRGIAEQLRFDLCRREQLHRLADAYERFAARSDALGAAT